MGILVVNVALLAQIRWQPFESDTLDALETAGLAVAVFTLCVPQTALGEAWVITGMTRCLHTQTVVLVQVHWLALVQRFCGA